MALEGGYNCESVSACVEKCVNALITETNSDGEDALLNEIEEADIVSPLTIEAVNLTKKMHSFESSLFQCAGLI